MIPQHLESHVECVEYRFRPQRTRRSEADRSLPPSTRLTNLLFITSRCDAYPLANSCCIQVVGRGHQPVARRLDGYRPRLLHSPRLCRLVYIRHRHPRSLSTIHHQRFFRITSPECRRLTCGYFFLFNAASSFGSSSFGFSIAASSVAKT